MESDMGEITARPYTNEWSLERGEVVILETKTNYCKRPCMSRTDGIYGSQKGLGLPWEHQSFTQEEKIDCLHTALDAQVGIVVGGCGSSFLKVSLFT